MVVVVFVFAFNKLMRYHTNACRSVRLVFFLRGAVGPQAQLCKIKIVICLQVIQANQVRGEQRERESQLEEIDQTTSSGSGKLNDGSESTN